MSRSTDEWPVNGRNAPELENAPQPNYFGRTTFYSHKFEAVSFFSRHTSSAPFAKAPLLLSIVANAMKFSTTILQSLFAMSLFQATRASFSTSPKTTLRYLKKDDEEEDRVAPTKRDCEMGEFKFGIQKWQRPSRCVLTDCSDFLNQRVHHCRIQGTR